MFRNVSETRWPENWSGRGTALVSRIESKASKPEIVPVFFKVIIAGSRNFNDYEMLRRCLDYALRDKVLLRERIEIVSGTANGADKLGERYAEEKGYKLTKMPADWENFGKAAGYKRNEDMAKYADACVCFWDGYSRGTKHMINLAKQYKIKLKVYEYK